MHVPRTICVVGAVAAFAWFVIGVRQAHGTGRADGILSASKTATPAEAHTVTSLLDEARLLNPDQEVNILRGQLALERGQPQRAQRILAAVTRAEPQNIEAWLWLARAATNNSQLFDRALRRVRQLEPLVHAH